MNQSKNQNTTIYVPKGTYEFTTGAIVLHSNLTFLFENGGLLQVNGWTGSYICLSKPPGRLHGRHSEYHMAKCNI
ncbi:hypothetical protein [Lactiplantibacillus pentosus]|uniref:hypothetical protein n=1 Tax=Lactiplantibacillus pentosus TaxID=1589 RepID=UPI00384B2562